MLVSDSGAREDGPHGLIEYLESRGGIPALDGKIGEAEDIAAVALLLASDAGRYCSATTFVVDGGELSRGAIS